MTQAKRPLHVLLVEDDEDDYLLTRDLLARMEGTEVEVEWVATADAGLEALREGDYDVCLLDWRLGPNDGLEVLREAIRAGARAPIIMLTGRGDRELDLDAMRAGAADYLVKGEIEPQSLERSIRYSIAHKRLHNEAQQAVRARDELLGVVSHDLRSPLHVISSSVEFLRVAIGPNREQAELLDLIERSVSRMNRLIQDLLDVAGIEAGRLSIARRPEQPETLLAEAVATCRHLAAKRALRLREVVAGGLPPVMADRDRVLQVLCNLIENGLKFTPQGGAVSVRAERDEGAVRFTVEDTGRGIPPEFLPHVFNRFYRGPRPVHDGEKGTGLGLTIARGIVEAHGGRIWIQSEVDVGTTVSFTLPSERA